VLQKTAALLACFQIPHENLLAAAAFVTKTEKEWQADCTHSRKPDGTVAREYDCKKDFKGVGA
jgi:hypothetical protein